MGLKWGCSSPGETRLVSRDVARQVGFDVTVEHGRTARVFEEIYV